MNRIGIWLIWGALGGTADPGREEAQARGKVVRVPSDHATLQKGIDAAEAGDTVLVEAGTYKERVRLKAGVALKSAGGDAPGKVGLARAEATVIDGEGKAEGGPGVILAEGAVLDGFSVTGIGKFDQADYEKHYATRGENLPDERGAGGPADGPYGVALQGVTAVVRNCIVHDNGDAGISCTGPNASWIFGNSVHRNMGGGISVGRGASPLVEKNRCFNNLRAGIGNRQSAGTLLANECYDNVRSGIGIREGARPTLRGNACHKNRRSGIGIRMEGTAPVVEDNGCFENGMSGIGCRDGAEPLLRGNRCHDNALAGVGARSGARPVISGNKCYRNQAAGVGLESGARAHVAMNECYENGDAGIGHRGDVETTLEGNHVHDNKAAGIGFEPSASGKSTVIGNKVIDNGAVAVGIHPGWKVRLSGNEFVSKAGMQPLAMVYAGAEADFTENIFRGGGVAGIRTEGMVRASGNSFESPSLRKVGPPSYAVWGLAGADIAMTGNTASGWRHALFAEKAAVRAFQNRVSNYGSVAIRIVDPPSPVAVIGNVFASEADSKGVEVTGGRGLIEDNRIEKPK